MHETYLIFTKTNSDPEGLIINQMIDDYVKKNCEKSISFASLGQLNYLSIMKNVDGIIGNSSSAIIESPSFKKGVINIGNRQKGRVMGKNIINCDNSIHSIKLAIKKLFSDKFQLSLKTIYNPYGNGNAAKKTLHILKKKEIISLNKQFYNIIN